MKGTAMSARNSPATRLATIAGLITVSTLVLAGCAVDDSSLNGGTAKAPAETTEIKLIGLHDDLAALVPDKDADRTLVYATSDNTPYFSIKSDGSFEGLAVDMVAQFESILGIEIELQTTTLDATIPGIQSGRIDISGPAGDFTERQELVDFSDVAKSNVTLLVSDDGKFTPASSADLCGTDLGIKKGAGTQNVLDAVSAECVANGDEAVSIATYADLAQANLALRSARIQAVVAPTAPNSIAASQTNSGFEVITIDDMQTLPAATATYGFETAKDSGLADALVGALRLMHEEGVYGQLFDKWNIPASAIEADQLVVNGSTQAQKG